MAEKRFLGVRDLQALVLLAVLVPQGKPAGSG